MVGRMPAADLSGAEANRFQLARRGWHAERPNSARAGLVLTENLIRSDGAVRIVIVERRWCDF